MLSHSHPDKHGFVPTDELIGQILTHTKDGNPQYIITDVTWLGATDEWGFVARSIGDGALNATVTRPLSHLYGNRENGENRYQEWVYFSAYAVE